MVSARRWDPACLQQPHGPVPHGIYITFLLFGNLGVLFINFSDMIFLLQAEIGLTAADDTDSSGSVDIFAGALADGGAAVVFFNRASTTANATLALSELDQLPGWTIPEGKAMAHDVWSGKKLEFTSDESIVGMVALPSGDLEPHGSSFIRLTKTTK